MSWEFMHTVWACVGGESLKVWQERKLVKKGRCRQESPRQSCPPLVVQGNRKSMKRSTIFFLTLCVCVCVCVLSCKVGVCEYFHGCAEHICVYMHVETWRLCLELSLMPFLPYTWRGGSLCQTWSMRLWLPSHQPTCSGVQSPEFQWTLSSQGLYGFWVSELGSSYLYTCFIHWVIFLAHSQGIPPTFFKYRGLLCKHGWYGTLTVDQAGFKLRDMPTSASWVLGSKECASMPSPRRLILFYFTFMRVDALPVCMSVHHMSGLRV